MRFALILLLLFVVVLTTLTLFYPHYVGSVIHHNKSTIITSQELVDILNTNTLIYASTTHSQMFLVTTKWGFRYHGIWNRGNQIERIEPNIDSSDVLNLINGYSKNKGYKVKIECE
jgi:uncharacterized membrane protein (Fun14 family)